MRKIITSIIVFSLIGFLVVVITFWGSSNTVSANQKQVTLRDHGPAHIDEGDTVRFLIFNGSRKPISTRLVIKNIVTGEETISRQMGSLPGGAGYEVIIGGGEKEKQLKKGGYIFRAILSDMLNVEVALQIFSSVEVTNLQGATHIVLACNYSNRTADLNPPW